jgi:hypothetical protein
MPENLPNRARRWVQPTERLRSKRLVAAQSHGRIEAAGAPCGQLGGHEQEFGERLDYMHMNPARKGLVKQPEDWRRSSYNNFASYEAKVAMYPTQIDYVYLPPGYRA